MSFGNQLFKCLGLAALLPLGSNWWKYDTHDIRSYGQKMLNRHLHFYNAWTTEFEVLPPWFHDPQTPNVCVCVEDFEQELGCRCWRGDWLSTQRRWSVTGRDALVSAMPMPNCNEAVDFGISLLPWGLFWKLWKHYCLCSSSSPSWERINHPNILGSSFTGLEQP